MGRFQLVTAHSLTLLWGWTTKRVMLAHHSLLKPSAQHSEPPAMPTVYYACGWVQNHGRVSSLHISVCTNCSKPMKHVILRKRSAVACPRQISLQLSLPAHQHPSHHCHRHHRQLHSDLSRSTHKNSAVNTNSLSNSSCSQPSNSSSSWRISSSSTRPCISSRFWPTPFSNRWIWQYPVA